MRVRSAPDACLSTHVTATHIPFEYLSASRTRLAPRQSMTKSTPALSGRRSGRRATSASSLGDSVMHELHGGRNSIRASSHVPPIARASCVDPPFSAHAVHPSSRARSRIDASSAGWRPRTASSPRRSSTWSTAPVSLTSLAQPRSASRSRVSTTSEPARARAQVSRRRRRQVEERSPIRPSSRAPGSPWTYLAERLVAVRTAHALALVLLERAERKVEHLYRMPGRDRA